MNCTCMSCTSYSREVRYTKPPFGVPRQAPRQHHAVTSPHIQINSLAPSHPSPGLSRHVPAPLRARRGGATPPTIAAPGAAPPPPPRRLPARAARDALARRGAAGAARARVCDRGAGLLRPQAGPAGRRGRAAPLERAPRVVRPPAAAPRHGPRRPVGQVLPVCGKQGGCAAGGVCGCAWGLFG